MLQTKPSRSACIIAADGYVCGVGVDPDAARADAVRNMFDLDDGTFYDVRPCTSQLEALFRKYGGNLFYDDQNGVLAPITEDTSESLFGKACSGSGVCVIEAIDADSVEPGPDGRDREENAAVPV